ncbi:MAG: EAL domain-containing protein [Curvibacter sp.]|nr:EAL domain-containing protein [Curvibacter sp.]
MLAAKGRGHGAAKYQAKAQGRNRHHLYTREMTAQARERISLEARLRKAIAGDGLDLHFQPRADAMTGRHTGVEALLRWCSPELGDVATARFILVVEETGYIEELGHWALDQACRQRAQWDATGLHVPVFAINFSVR